MHFPQTLSTLLQKWWTCHRAMGDFSFQGKKKKKKSIFNLQQCFLKRSQYFFPRVKPTFLYGNAPVLQWSCVTLLWSPSFSRFSGKRSVVTDLDSLLLIYSFAFTLFAGCFFPTSTTTLSEHCYAKYIHIYKYYFIFLGGSGWQEDHWDPKWKISYQLIRILPSFIPVLLMMFPVLFICFSVGFCANLSLYLSKNDSFLSLYLSKNVRADPLLSSCCATESGTTLLIWADLALFGIGRSNS